MTAMRHWPSAVRRLSRLTRINFANCWATQILRELLDADAIAEVEEQLQSLTDAMRARSADGMHDLLLRLGDLTREELGASLREC